MPTASLHPRHNAIAELDAQIARAEVTRSRHVQDLQALPGARRTRVLLRQAEERLAPAAPEPRNAAFAAVRGGGAGHPESRPATGLSLAYAERAAPCGVLTLPVMVLKGLLRDAHHGSRRCSGDG
jgi:hypothetical protein